MMNRRKFLFGLAAVGAVSALPLTTLWAKQKQWLVSACNDKQGNFFAAAFDLQGQLINKVPLPARGHEVIPLTSKPGHALVFARRPGNYVLEVDFNTGEVVNQVSVAPEQRFYGHGVLTDNDNILLTTENDYQQAKGLIVVRDRHTNKVLEQYDSGGIGPHQLALMPSTNNISNNMSNNRQVVIANGGIQTHPEQARKKLNLTTMQPNLAYMDLNDGKIVDSFSLENKQLSIRHLAVSNQGKVIAGLQYQGASTDEVPLAISHHGEAQLQLLQADTNIWRSMKQYTASVCINDAENTVAISCPKASLLTYWQLDTGKYLASHKLKDGAGLALVNNTYIASTGRGHVIAQKNINSAYQEKATFTDLRWDNHMTAIASR